MSRKRKNRVPPQFVGNRAEVIGVKRALDAYSNVSANLGTGARNLSETGQYLLERFTWDYQTLNALFRNNWIAKNIIEKPANEMMKNGFTILSDIKPEKINAIERAWQRTGTERKFLRCLKWARLYGGCVLIPLIEGQDDLESPLDYDTITPGSYKGCFYVDRWSGVSPSPELVTDINDPHLGTPEFYDITDNATGETVRFHHSRVIKMIGRELPQWEEIAENYWGASELEHVFQELKKRDSTSANLAFLIFLSNIRVFQNEGLSQMLTLGDQQAASDVYNTMRSINDMMCNTGMLVLDKDAQFHTEQYSFSGINDVYESFMLDISGAAEIPIDKLFGRSPSGFNDGSETLQNYYDTLQEKQETYVRPALEQLLGIVTVSAIGEMPDDFQISFNPIRRSSDEQRKDLAIGMSEPLFTAYSQNLVGKATVLKELKQQSELVGLWTNISDEMINEAEREDEEREKEEAQLTSNLQAQVREIGGGMSESAEKTDELDSRAKNETEIESSN